MPEFNKTLIMLYCKEPRTFCGWCHKQIVPGEQMLDEPIPRGGGMCIHYHPVPCYFEKLGIKLKGWK
jgi:hypothetical protein